MEYILSLSYRKDSLACLGAIESLNLPLTRIVHAEIWATDTIPAELPPMIEFKKKADKIIKERWGIEVEHYKSELTFEKGFYKKIKEETVKKRIKEGRQRSKYIVYNEEKAIWGFPVILGPWCNSKLKMATIKKIKKEENAISYIGLAVEEEKRIKRQEKK